MDINHIRISYLTKPRESCRSDVSLRPFCLSCGSVQGASAAVALVKRLKSVIWPSRWPRGSLDEATTNRMKTWKNQLGRNCKKNGKNWETNWKKIGKDQEKRWRSCKKLKRQRQKEKTRKTSVKLGNVLIVGKLFRPVLGQIFSICKSSHFWVKQGKTQVKTTSIGQLRKTSWEKFGRKDYGSMSVRKMVGNLLMWTSWESNKAARRLVCFKTGQKLYLSVKMIEFECGQRVQTLSPVLTWCIYNIYRYHHYRYFIDSIVRIIRIVSI